jgi:hypothetical protein
MTGRRCADIKAAAMMLCERRLNFPSAVLCAGPAGVYFAFGVEIEGNAEAGLARVRALDAEGSPLPFTVFVDLRHRLNLHVVGTARETEAMLPVAGGTGVLGYGEDGRLILCVQTTLQVERDSLGVLVLAPGPDIPWTLGVHAGRVKEFLAALDECAAGVAGVAVA